MTKEQLKKWRKINNMSQTDAADIFGVTLRALQHWEYGDRQIPNYVTIIIKGVKS